MKIFKFESFEIDGVTKLTEEKPEDIYKIRDLNTSYGHLIMLRTSIPQQKFYFMLCRKKPTQKKVLQTVIFSNFSNVDYMSIHVNTCPEIFKKLFNDGAIIGNQDFLILSASYLLMRVHTRYIKDKNDGDDLNEPHLSYFRYKLECLLLQCINQKPNRPDLVCGKTELNSGESFIIEEC